MGGYYKMSNTMNGTIVWLNGWGMPNELWQSLQSCFPDYAQITLDFSRLDRVEAFLAEARLSVQGAEHQPVFAVGWSLGGLLAQQLAANGEVAGIALLGTTARFMRSNEETDKGWPDAYLRQMITTLKRDREKVIAKFRQLLFSKNADNSIMSKSFPEGDTWTLEALLTGLAYLRSEDTRPALDRITCPAVIVHGLEDTVCPFGAAVELADGIGHAEFMAYEDAGHVPFWGRELETAEAIRRMLNEGSRQNSSSSTV